MDEKNKTENKFSSSFVEYFQTNTFLDKNIDT